MTDLAVCGTAVSKVFHSKRGDVVALDRVDFSVRTGEFVSLLGPSGCGKSTLLRLIGDLEPMTSGELTIAGKPPALARADREYGMVFQQAGLLDWRTVRANIELPLKIMGYDSAARRSRADEMIRLVRLDAFADHYPWQLSGGMQQRVSIARALSFEPAIMLMDEPLGALDEMNREYLQGELLRIRDATHTTVVFVTHSVSEAVFLSDRVCIMSPRPGRIVEDVAIGLPRERDDETRRSEDFFAIASHVRESLHAVLEPGVEP